MLQKIPTAFLHPGTSHPQFWVRPLARPLALWLLRCWESQCRQAERPSRIVPYY